jgi:hypothetical protein
MTNFEQDKADKLKRILPLRIMNAIGMVAWREDKWGCAEQKIRILHPLSWPWVIALVLFAVVMHGVIEVWEEIKRLPEDMVWW